MFVKLEGLCVWQSMCVWVVGEPVAVTGLAQVRMREPVDEFNLLHSPTSGLSDHSVELPLLPRRPCPEADVKADVLGEQGEWVESFPWRGAECKLF